MSNGTLVLIVVALGTYALKSAGPLLLGNRTLPPRFLALIGAMPPALLAALVVVNTVVERGHLVLDARIIGVAAAVAALMAKRGFVTVVLVAAVTTAIARRLGVS
jgi:uncharacterized membrane protein